jgi:hypothetical protein
MNANRFVSTLCLPVILVLGASALGGCAADAAAPDQESDPAEKTGGAESALAVGSGGSGSHGYTCSGLHCSCTGDVDCNDMFSDGVCGDIAVCDDTNPTPTCECLAIRVVRPRPFRVVSTAGTAGTKLAR